MPRVVNSDILKLHFIVFIWGFTATLGKLISISAIELVWYRMLIAAMSLFIIMLVSKSIKKRKAGISSSSCASNRAQLVPKLKFILTGFIVAAHWITFFHAVKVSNISITLVCLSSAAIFTSLLEPIILKKKISFLEVFIGLCVMAGLYLIFRFESIYLLGIILATTSAFLAALFTVINKVFIDQKHTALHISLYEMIGGFIVISLYLFFYQNIPLGNPTFNDVIYLLILGVVCTAYPFWISVDLMKNLSAYMISLTINLEPIYGIIIAFLVFGNEEQMTFGFYFGATFVLASVFLYPYLCKRKKRINI